MRIRLFSGLRAILAAVFAFVFAVQAQAATLIDIYGPGQNQINLSKGLLTTEEFDSLKKLIMLEDQLPYSSLMEE